MKVISKNVDPCLAAKLAYVDSLKEPECSRHFLDEPETFQFMTEVPKEETTLEDLDTLRLYKKNLNSLIGYNMLRDHKLSLVLEAEVNRVIEFLQQEGRKILLVR